MKVIRIFVAVLLTAAFGVNDALAQLPPPPPHPRIHLKAPPRPRRKAPPRPRRLHIKLPHIKLPPHPPAPPRPF